MEGKQSPTGRYPFVLVTVADWFVLVTNTLLLFPGIQFCENGNETG